MPLNLILVIICGLIGGILFIVGFATDYWLTWTGGNQGLWKFCLADACSDLTKAPKLEDYMVATQALMIIGLIILVGYFVAVGVRLFKESTPVIAVALILGFSHVLFAVIAYIVFAYNSHYPAAQKSQIFTGYSFYLSAVGSGIVFLSTVILAVSSARSSYERM